jgi:hypothetical protein
LIWLLKRRAGVVSSEALWICVIVCSYAVPLRSLRFHSRIVVSFLCIVMSFMRGQNHRNG